MTTHCAGKSFNDRFAGLDQRLILDGHAFADLPGPGLDPEPGDHTAHSPREVGQDIKGYYWPPTNSWRTGSGVQFKKNSSCRRLSIRVAPTLELPQAGLRKNG